MDKELAGVAPAASGSSRSTRFCNPRDYRSRKPLPRSSPSSSVNSALPE